jgi:hypothetical protein
MTHQELQDMQQFLLENNGRVDSAAMEDRIRQIAAKERYEQKQKLLEALAFWSTYWLARFVSFLLGRSHRPSRLTIVVAMVCMILGLTGSGITAFGLILLSLFQELVIQRWEPDKGILLFIVRVSAKRIYGGTMETEETFRSPADQESP